MRLSIFFPHIAPVVMAGSARAQLPDSFTNLKVLPTDISREELVTTMKGFTRGLGVRCVFCHVGDDTLGWGSFDFASDLKPTKRPPAP